MSTLQWALLLLGMAIALALVWSSWRERRTQRRLGAPPAQPATRDWSSATYDVPAATRIGSEAAKGGPAAFDDLGVGKARRRVAPEVTPGAPVANPPARPAERLIGFYIAEHEGTNILGPKIHAALAERGLRFGVRRIYHRLDGDQPVFSVASLVKPGALDPAEAEGFATPGLSVFMVLPGPAQPLAAFQDMLDTARGLARALNAELYDSEQRAPLTAERAHTLHEQVEEWARRNAAVARPGA
ncbi:MAG: cell division protein ZipA C-terminal FtsZ-binding domain-containing protein [Betaproteobacteria bacterium]